MESRCRRVWRSGAALAMLLGLFVAGVGGAWARRPYAGTAAEAVRTDQILVKLRADVAGRMDGVQQRAVIESIASRAGRGVAYGLDHGGGVHTLRLGKRLDADEVQAIAAQVAADVRVAYAEPDEIMRASLEPNDGMYGQQWSMSVVGGGSYGANLPAAWDVETGDPGIVVAVIDTGYRPHADLSGRFVAGYDFVDLDYDGSTYVPASANDGDGRDADARDPGDWVSAAENASGFFKGCGASNSSWHGTHVAGTIGAVSNNGFGVTGINWRSKILPVRVLGKCGGYTSDIIDGMRWAAGLSVAGVPANANPARVINLSLGGAGPCPVSYQTAINEILAQGVIVVVAAGNEGGDASNSRPGNCAGVITVAATARNGSLAYYSNRGSLLEIAAPGGDRSVDSKVLSTLNAGTTTPAEDSYASYQGTSMAAPHVAGIASLVLSVDPCLTPSQVDVLLENTATSFPVGAACLRSTCGAGIVNAGAAVAAAQSGAAARKAAVTTAPPVLPMAAAAHSISTPIMFRDWSSAKCY